MKFDVTVFRFLSDADLRVLTAVEIGMKNHQLVPTSLICSLCNLRSGFSICLSNLHRYKLIHHDSSHHDCYRLTPLGYDILALRVLLKREAIHQVGNRIGVGKEAEVYQAVTYMSSLGHRLNGEDDDDEEDPVGQDDAQLVKVALKFHRLGKVSFRNVKQTRDYLQNRKCKSWLYMSRLAAKREHQVMEELYKRGFEVPEPLECNRHAIVMQLIKSSSTLAQVSKNSIRNAHELCVKLVQFAIRLAKHGLIHCDLNEFNVLVFNKAPQIDDYEDQHSVHEGSIQPLTNNSDPNEEGVVYHTVGFSVIDFPQVVSTSHQLAPYFLQRDMASLFQVFSNKFGVDVDAALAEAVGDQLYLFEDSRDGIEPTTEVVKLRKIYMDEEDMFSEEEVDQDDDQNDHDDIGVTDETLGNVDDLDSDVLLGNAGQTNDDDHSVDESEEDSDGAEDDEDRLGSVDPKFNAMVPIHAMEMFCSMKEVALDVQLEISGYVKPDKAAIAEAAKADLAIMDHGDNGDNAEYFSSSEEEQTEQKEGESNENGGHVNSQLEKGANHGKKDLDFKSIASKVRKDRERQQVRKKKNKAALHGANRRETKTQMNHQIEDY